MIGSTQTPAPYSAVHGANLQKSLTAEISDRTITFNKHAWLDAVCQSTVSDGAKLRALALWHFANKSGFCWPNQDQIEAAIGHKSIKRTSSYMKELEIAGFICRGYQPTGSAGKRSANYQLLMPTKAGGNTVFENSNASAEPDAQWRQVLHPPQEHM